MAPANDGPESRANATGAESNKHRRPNVNQAPIGGKSGGPGSVTAVLARIGGPDGQVKRFVGRAAWALNELVSAGSQGITSLQNPAPRLSHYVFLLRRNGVGISTEHEGHTGAYAGHHGRYRLTIPVEILETTRAGA